MVQIRLIYIPYICNMKKLVQNFERIISLTSTSNLIGVVCAEEAKRLSINFGRWLLKYADSHFEPDGVLCWKYNNKKVDTDKLFEIFLKQYV